MVLLSAVLSTVLNSCISLTVPDWPCASMKSPTRYGLKSSTITPPAKFCNVPLRAIPIARPADANNATNEVVSIPRMPMITVIRKNVSAILTRFCRNVRRDGST